MERLPTPVFWPGEFHGLYSPWGRKESDMTEQLSQGQQKTLSGRWLHLLRVIMVVVGGLAAQLVLAGE